MLKQSTFRPAALAALLGLVLSTAAVIARAEFTGSGLSTLLALSRVDHDN